MVTGDPHLVQRERCMGLPEVVLVSLQNKYDSKIGRKEMGDMGYKMVGRAVKEWNMEGERYLYV